VVITSKRLCQEAKILRVCRTPERRAHDIFKVKNITLNYNKASGTRSVFLLDCLRAGYAGYLAGNGLSSSSAARFSAGFS